MSMHPRGCRHGSVRERHCDSRIAPPSLIGLSSVREVTSLIGPGRGRRRKRIVSVASLAPQASTVAAALTSARGIEPHGSRPRSAVKEFDHGESTTGPADQTAVQGAWLRSAGDQPRQNATEARKRHLGEQGRQGNIKQNTTTKATSRTGDANPRPRTSGSANSNATRLSCGLSASPNRGRRASSMTLDTTSG
jgi:hypothetical protein